MKTIFVTSFHQFISRNILHTPILDGLLAMPDVRIVILAPADKKEYFENEFKNNGICVEYVNTSRAANGLLSLLFKRIAWAMGGLRSKAVVRGLLANRYRELFFGIFFYHPLKVLGKFAPVHSLVRFLNSRLVKSVVVASLFTHYSPELVFSTDVYNENDVLVMTEARRRGARIVSMVRSWDNTEMYGLLRVIPDTLLVWGDFSKAELFMLNRINPANVHIVGIPHYDRYCKGPTMSRDEFFQSIHADPRRKLVLYTPVGDMYLKKNDVDGLVLSEFSTIDANILVRMPPTDTVSFDGFNPPVNVFFYQPGTGTNRTGRSEISRADDDHLINSLYFSDLVVCGPSSIMLDATFFNKPVVVLGFERNKKKYGESMMSLYDSRHLKAVIGNGGARIAKSVQDFHSIIAEYLSDPEKDAVARRRVVAYICFKTDGKSCERVVNILKMHI